MKLKYIEIPDDERRKPKYVEWYGLLDEFVESGHPSALIDGIDASGNTVSLIRSAVKRRYENVIAVCVRNGKVYLRRKEEEMIG